MPRIQSVFTQYCGSGCKLSGSVFKFNALLIIHKQGRIQGGGTRETLPPPPEVSVGKCKNGNRLWTNWQNKTYFPSFWPFLVLEGETKNSIPVFPIFFSRVLTEISRSIGSPQGRLAGRNIDRTIAYGLS